MKITDYADAINVELRLRRHQNQENRWTAQFERCEVKEGGCLAGTYGNGKTPIQAIADYVAKIRGARIVFDAFDKERRREFTVPVKLEPAE